MTFGCAGPATEFPSIGAGDIAVERERQLSFQLLSYVEQTARLHAVYHRVATANAEFCDSQMVAGRLGVWAVAPKDVPERYRAIAQSTLNLDADHPTVIAVADGGPGARAGLMVGDSLIAFDGRRPPNDGTSAWVSKVLESKGRSRLQVDILRQGKPMRLSVVPDLACTYPVSLALDNESNAFTDGKRIVVFSGMMRLVQNDAELAAILGHELAHINMGHIDKRRGNQIAGAIGGFVLDIALAAAGVDSQGAFTRGFGDAGLQAFSKDFEREADYVGAYYVARAGYDMALAERVWRTLAQEDPRQIFFAGTHPTSPERFLLLQQANAEIVEKRRLKMPLRPELKKDAAVTAIASEGH